MRVLIILREFYSPSRPIGGAERQALRLASGLLDQGIDVTVVTGRWEPGQPRSEEINCVPVQRHFAGGRLSSIKGFRRVGMYLYLLSLFLYLIRHRKQYDLIHCHSAIFGASVAVLAGRLLKKKTLVRAMASGPWGDIKRLREGEKGTIWGARWMLNQMLNADCIVALNQEVSKELVEIGFQANRILYIPNGVEVEQLKRKMDYRLDHEITVSYLGRLHPQKGLDTLLSAFQQVQSEAEQFSWRLGLIGTGVLHTELEVMAKELGIDQYVEFFGQVEEPASFLSKSDIFVLPSRSEGISNSLLEAMATGLPCIVTDIPGNNDVITHRRNGLIVKLDDHKDLAHALISLAGDQRLREFLGKEATKTVEEKYSLDRVVDQYFTLYTSLLQ